jgi:hypothetical protein
VEIPRPDLAADDALKQVIGWFRRDACPLLRRLDPGKAEELDADLKRLESIRASRPGELEICFLGLAGVGKSTLINALVDSSLPEGDVGPLTAQALTIQVGDVSRFTAEYHGGDRLNRLILGLESQLRAGATPGTPADEDTDARPDRARRSLCLMVTGQQDTDVTPQYLIDSLRSLFGTERKFGTEPRPEDEGRLKRLAEVLRLVREQKQAGAPHHERSGGIADAAFMEDLLDHAAGFLAPLIRRLDVYWPSALLREGLRLVDLPGVGSVDDVKQEITREYVRERARGVVLVVGNRGLQEPDADLLRSSGFLNRLLFAADDPSADPVQLVVAATRIDDSADSAHRLKPARSWLEHFSDLCGRAASSRRQEIQKELARVWPPEDARPEDARQDVLRRLTDQLQVFPLSAPQLRLLQTRDRRAMIENEEQSGVPALSCCLRSLARERRQAWANRLTEERDLFCSRAVSPLRVLQARWQAEDQAVLEAERLRQQLRDFLQPLSKEFSNRQGAFRAFLSDTVPARIAAVVADAGARARRGINGHVSRLNAMHHRTLQAAVRRGGRFEGASGEIDLPRDFGLCFEEPIAEAWGRTVLAEIRQRTQEYAGDCVALVEQVIEWARAQGGAISTDLVEAQRDALQADARKLVAVGRDAADQLRATVRRQLIRDIDAPIREQCRQFVAAGRNEGGGLKDRILGLLGELADHVIEAAGKAALGILLSCFRHVEKEIKEILANHQDPLAAAAAALLSSQEETLRRKDRVERKKIQDEILAVLASSPCAATPSNGGQETSR